MDRSAQRNRVSDPGKAPVNKPSHRGSVLYVDQIQSAIDDARKALVDAGYLVTWAGSASDARHAVRTGAFDLVIVDPSLPDDDGLKLVQDLASNDLLSIIVVSHRTRTVHKVVALEMGADDYLIKPADSDELVARANALLRKVRKMAVGRSPQPATIQQDYCFDGWIYESSRRDLRDSSGQLVNLTSMETDLLEAFLKSPGVPLSRQSIVGHLGKHGETASLRHVDVLVSKLRRKIEIDGKIRIKTIRGAGYMFVSRPTT